MGRQTEYRDYSEGQYPDMAIIRSDNRYLLVHVAERLSARLAVLDRHAEECPLAQHTAPGA